MIKGLDKFTGLGSMVPRTSNISIKQDILEKKTLLIEKQTLEVSP